MKTEYWYVLEMDDGVLMFAKIKTVADIVEIPKAFAKRGYRLVDCITGEELKRLGVIK